MNIYLRNSDKDFQRCARDSNKGELCPNRTMRQDRKDSACTGPISARIPWLYLDSQRNPVNKYT